MLGGGEGSVAPIISNRPDYILYMQIIYIFTAPWRIIEVII